PRFSSFLSLVEQIAPYPLSHSAQGLNSLAGGHWQEILAKFWEADSGSPVNLEPEYALLSWIFLQPYAEYLADHSEWTPPNGTPAVCPLCGGKPQVGALRQEGDGGNRSLICSLCGTEWPYRRIVCPARGEEDVETRDVCSTVASPQTRRDGQS